MKRIIFALLLLGLALALVACEGSGAPGTLPTQVPSPSPGRVSTRVPTPVPPTSTVFSVPTVGPPTPAPTTIGATPGRPTLTLNPAATSTPVATAVLPSTITLTTPITGTVMVGAGHKLNVREAPSVGSFANNELAPGTQVTIVGKTLDEKWLRISTPAAGWISSDFVTLVSGQTITGQMPRAGGYQSNYKIDTETKVEYMEEPFVSSGNSLVDWLAQTIHQLFK